ncbi:ethylene-responsive transcription factor ERF039-like protein [Tanacetum coccineum]
MDQMTCSSAKEGKFRKKTKKTDSHDKENSVYRGVRRRSWGKWVSEIHEPKNKSRIWLETFDNPEKEAKAHDVAAIVGFCVGSKIVTPTIKGTRATLNFPHLAHLLPKPASTSPDDIRAAAIKAATLAINEINPRSQNSNSIKAELQPEVDGSDFSDDAFLDLPDLLIDHTSRINHMCFTFSGQITRDETADNKIWLEDNYMWNNYCY